MKISEVMTPNPSTVAPTETIQNTAKLMRDEDAGSIPVVENGRVIGMVTDRDIVVRAVAEGAPMTKAVRDIVSTGDVIFATPEMTTKEAEVLMSEYQVRRLPVIDDNQKLVGIVSLGDIAVKEGRDSRTGDTLENISEGVKRVH